MRADVTAVLLAVIAILTVVSFFPVTNYYFAQDDFVLIERARNDFSAELSRIATAPGQFRPLTKLIYFAAMDAVFGLRALPYHLTSLFACLVNIGLMFLLLRRLRVGDVAALVATAFFASNVAFLHIVGWVSCIQQLAAMGFMLVSIISGVDDLNRPSKRSRLVSLSALALALLSMEQAVATPVILFTYGMTLLPGRPGVRKIATRLAPHGLIMLIYFVWVLIIKGVPDSGPYAMGVGENVPANFYAYTGWMYEYWLVIQYRAPDWPYMSASHVVMVLLVAYHIARGRPRVAVFGVVSFIVTILPVLFLANHLFYLHTYMAAIGPIVMLAAAIDDVAVRLSPPRSLAAGGAALVIVAALFMSAVRVRQSEAAMMDDVPYPRSFVFRRANIAERVRDDVARIIDSGAGVRRVDMIYGGQPDAHWNISNVRIAIGEASGLKLFLNNPDLEVEFSTFADPPNRKLPGAQPLVFTDLGECYTIDEVRDLRSKSDPQK